MVGREDGRREGRGKRVAQDLAERGVNICGGGGRRNNRRRRREGARLIEEQAPNMRFCTARPDFTSWSGVNSFQVIKHI